MTIIQRHNGETIDLDDAGIRTRDFIISSPTPVHKFDTVEGAMGVIDYGTSIGPREINVYFRAISKDIDDFSLLRDEIFDIFRTEESFWLIEKRVKGKRWLAKVQNPYSIPQRNIFGNFEITFIGLKGVAESTGTTQDIERNGINANSELWGYGMGLIADDDSLKYTHIMNRGQSTRVYNAGNVSVHPFKQDLIVRISDVVGSTDFLQVRNTVNETIVRITESVSVTDTIEINGPVVTINGLNALDKTNYEFIELGPGWNNFRLTGAESARVEFDFRFYYK